MGTLASILFNPGQGFWVFGYPGSFFIQLCGNWCHNTGIKYLVLDTSFHMWTYVDTEFEICSPNVCQTGKGGNKKSLWQTALHQNWVCYLSVTTWKNHFWVYSILFQGNLRYSVSKILQLLGIFLVLDYILGGTIWVYWYPTTLLLAGPDFCMGLWTSWWSWCKNWKSVSVKWRLQTESKT